MSGFKRYQSKVFWNQMRTQDLDCKKEENIIETTRPRPLPFPASRESEEAFSLSNEEEEEDNATDLENTTVIRIDIKSNETTVTRYFEYLH